MGGCEIEACECFGCEEEEDEEEVKNLRSMLKDCSV